MINKEACLAVVMIATFTSLLCNMLPVNHERSVRFPPVFRPRCDLLDLFYFTMQRLFFFCSFSMSIVEKYEVDSFFSFLFLFSVHSFQKTNVHKNMADRKSVV